MYCRPFASNFGILSDFKLVVYSSIPHFRQKGQKVDEIPSEAKYNTITVKSQTVRKVDCVGALWFLLVLNVAVLRLRSQRFPERWGGIRGEVSFSPHTLLLLRIFFRETTTMLRAITSLETVFLVITQQDVIGYWSGKNFSACPYEFLDASMIVLARIRIFYAG